MKTLTLQNTNFSDSRLEFQLAKIEKIRLIVFLMVMMLSFTSAILDSLIIGDQIAKIFKSKSDYYQILIGGQALVAHLIIALIHINKRLKKGQGVLMRYKIGTTILESLIPGLILIFLLNKLGIPALIDTPVIFLCIPILIISILHLDYRLTVLSGLLIVLCYAVAITLAVGYNEQAEKFTLQLPIPLYYIRCVIFIIATGCAAFVSHRFRKLLESRVRYEDERNQMEQLFSQQVSKQVVDALIENQDVSAKKEVTILFLDIRGFTNFVQGKDPEQVIDFQNKFFSPLIDIINKHNGITNQILGDGLMATFGAPVRLDNHEETALEAAKEIFQHVEKLGEVQIGMGIHSGDVVTGNIGNDNRKQFSVSGTTVIIASRLEQLNKEFKSRLLVSKDYFEQIENGVSNWSSLGNKKLKGIEKEIEVIKIL